MPALGMRPPVAPPSADSDVRRLVDSLLDRALVGLDLDGHVTFFSAGAERLYGYAAAEMLGAPLARLLVEDGEAAITRVLVAAARDGQVVERCWRARKGGDRICLLTTVQPVREADGTLRGFVEIGRDLTEELAAEARARRQRDEVEAARHHLATIVDCADDAVMIVDADGTIAYWNEASERLHGWRADEIVGRSMLTLIPADRAARCRARLDAVLGGERVTDIESVHLHKDGRALEVALRLVPIRDDAGHVRRIAAIPRDITVRKHAEAARDELEHSFDALVDAAPFLMLLHDGERIIRTSQATAHCFGYSSPAEMVGRPALEIVHPDERGIVATRMRESLASAATTPRQTRFVRRDGSVLHLETFGLPILHRGRPAVAVIGQDLTDRHLAEAALRRLVDELEESRRFLDEAQAGAQVGVFSVEIASGRCDWSTGMYRLFGVAKGTRVWWSTLVAHVHPGDRDQLAVDQLVEERSAFERTFRLLRGGEARWLRAVARVERDERGGAIRLVGTVQDVTEQKQVVDDRDRFFQLSQDLFCIVALDGSIKRTNPAFARTLGYSDEEVARLRFLELVHPDDLDAARAIRSKFGDARRAEVTCRLRCRDGSYRRVEWVVAPSVESGLLYAAGRDVTERHRVDEELRQSRRFLEETQAAANVGSWSSTLRPDSLDVWSEANYRIYGLPVGTPITFATFLSCVHPDDRAKIGKNLIGNDRVDNTFRIVRPDGAIRWVRNVATVERDAAGNVVRLYGTSQDLTERKAASDERERFFHLTQDQFCTVALDGRILKFSPGLPALLGHDADELRKMRWRDVSHADDLGLAIEEFRRLAADEAPTVRFTLRCRRRDGTYRWIEWAAVLDRAAGTVYASARDATERKALEEQFLQAQKMEAVGRLAGGIAHDFNNLLSVIQGIGELALSDLRAEDPLRADVGDMLTATQRAAALVRQLLAFSRRQVLQPRSLELHAVVVGAESMLRRLIGEDIELVIAKGDALGHVRADPGQLEQVLVNLAVNARDAMPRGGRLTIETADAVLDESFARRHAYVKPGRFVRLSVADTGVGMDAATRARVFEPFFTTKDVGRGTGLGLSTVYGIVKQSGGYIWVASEPGRGARFDIYLPCTDEATVALAQAATTTAPRPGSETILLVEDEPQVRRMMRRTLERAGYRVLEAADGEDGIRVARETPDTIHLVVSDVVMPRLGGPEMAVEVRKLRPQARVLFVSGYAEDAIAHDGILDGGSGFLGKPVQSEALLRKARELLDR